MSSALSSYLEETFCLARSVFAANAFESLAYGLGNGCRHALTSKLRKLLRQTVGFFVLNVQAHIQPFYPTGLPFYHNLAVSYQLSEKADS